VTSSAKGNSFSLISEDCLLRLRATQGLFLIVKGDFDPHSTGLPVIVRDMCLFNPLSVASISDFLFFLRGRVTLSEKSLV
jgi:hypothetical protein